VHCLAFTADNAKGLEALIYAVIAKVTLLYQAVFWVMENSPIRAGADAILAITALIAIKNNKAVLSFPEGLGRANVDTWRLCAVHAGLRKEVHLQVGILSGRRVLLLSSNRLNANPRTCRGAVFHDAGNAASFASYTSLLIDDQA
jgi:hypothetical protein